jgi:hypothetical protein
MDQSRVPKNVVITKWAGGGLILSVCLVSSLFDVIYFQDDITNINMKMDLEQVYIVVEIPDDSGLCLHFVEILKLCSGAGCGCITKFA